MGHINLKGGDLMFILFGIATFQMNCVLDEGGKGIGALSNMKYELQSRYVIITLFKKKKNWVNNISFLTSNQRTKSLLFIKSQLQICIGLMALII